jgi:hypothetical protein
LIQKVNSSRDNVTFIGQDLLLYTCCLVIVGHN